MMYCMYVRISVCMYVCVRECIHLGIDSEAKQLHFILVYELHEASDQGGHRVHPEV